MSGCGQGVALGLVVVADVQGCCDLITDCWWKPEFWDRSVDDSKDSGVNDGGGVVLCGYANRLKANCYVRTCGYCDGVVRPAGLVVATKNKAAGDFGVA